MAGAGVLAGQSGHRRDSVGGMPTPQREPLRRLSRAERASLQRIVVSSSDRIDRVRRATTLLAVARTGVFITPLSGSWLNMAESVQRILCGRALNGQHPQSAAEIITWLEDTVAGWNAAPTPFVWDGKRRERRLRAKLRRLGGSAAILANHQLIAA